MTLSYYRTDLETLRASQKLYYTITLENATIVHIDPVCYTTHATEVVHMEEVTFTYRSIRWSYEDISEGYSYEEPWTPESAVICGDANSDETVNVSDAVYIINYVFVGGNPPDPLCKGEANGDGKVNVSDAVYIINYVFVGGQPPVDDCCG